MPRISLSSVLPIEGKLQVSEYRSDTGLEPCFVMSPSLNAASGVAAANNSTSRSVVSSSSDSSIASPTRQFIQDVG